MYIITKEQILELENGVTLPKLKYWFPEVFETKLEVGKWYKNLEKGYKKSICCVMKLHGDNRQFSGYGIDYNGKWFYGEDTDQCGSENWIEATEQEVKTALENEAVKRGFKEGVYILSPKDKYKYKTIEDIFYYNLENNILSIGCYNIFNNGKWATIIPTLTKKEAEEKLGVKII